MKNIIILKANDLEKLEEETKILHHDFTVNLKKHKIEKGDYFGGYSQQLCKHVVFKALTESVYILYNTYDNTTDKDFISKCKIKYDNVILKGGN